MHNNLNDLSLTNKNLWQKLAQTRLQVNELDYMITKD